MNIYIQNDKEIKAICAGENDQHREYDVGVGLDIYDQRHGLPHDSKARAKYMVWLGIPMSREYEALAAED